ncbi:unnamed protein product, partial [Brenthis ino]
MEGALVKPTCRTRAGRGRRHDAIDRDGALDQLVARRLHSALCTSTPRMRRSSGDSAPAAAPLLCECEYAFQQALCYLLFVHDINTTSAY